MTRFKLTQEGRETFKHFAKFSFYHLKSEDIDPVYPVLKVMQRGMDQDTKLWHSYLYVAWYNIASAHAVFLKNPVPSQRILQFLEENDDFPTGVERRNLRGGRVYGHIQDYLRILEEEYDWDQQALYLDGVPHRRAKTQEERNENWLEVNANIQGIYGNGRWAAYKQCEILRRVNGFEIEAPDMGNQFSSGPRHGLERFYGEIEGESKDAISKLDAMGEDLQRKLLKVGIDVDIEHLETLLCDWNSVAKGKYYVGHDIDLIQEQILKFEEEGRLTEEEARVLWDARKEALPNQYLGELNGWVGVQKDRQKAFVKKQRIVAQKKGRR